MADQTFTTAVAQNLRTNEFTRVNHDFAGWNTAGDGTGTAYADAESLTLVATNAVLALYAQWTACHRPSFTTGGDAEWTVEADGSWRSGAITNSQTTWARVVVTGPCEVAFSWKTSSEAYYDKLHCTVDGEEKLSAISGEMSGWADVLFVLQGGEHVVEFSYAKDYAESDGEDCGWVKDCFVPMEVVQRSQIRQGLLLHRRREEEEHQRRAGLDGGAVLRDNRRRPYAPMGLPIPIVNWKLATISTPSRRRFRQDCRFCRTNRMFLGCPAPPDPACALDSAKTGRKFDIWLG